MFYMVDYWKIDNSYLQLESESLKRTSIASSYARLCPHSEPSDSPPTSSVAFRESLQRSDSVTVRESVRGSAESLGESTLRVSRLSE